MQNLETILEMPGHAGGAFQQDAGLTNEPASRADFETTQGIMRVRAASLSATDPFDFAMVVSGDEGVATIKALKMEFRLTTAHRVAIFDSLREAGFHTVLWHRHEAGSDKRTTRSYNLLKAN